MKQKYYDEYQQKWVKRVDTENAYNVEQDMTTEEITEEVERLKLEKSVVYTEEEKLFAKTVANFIISGIPSAVGKERWEQELTNFYRNPEMYK